MLIAFVGDIHGSIDDMYDYLCNIQMQGGQKIDVVVHVGDFGVSLPRDGEYGSKYQEVMAKWIHPFEPYWTGHKVAPIPTFVCPGNHEAWPALQMWMDAPDKVKNIKLIPDGGIIEINSISIGAIRGNYSYNSYKNPQRVYDCRRLKPYNCRSTHVDKAAVERLKQLGKIDILITHDAPQSMTPVYGPPPDLIAQQLGLDKDERTATGCPGFNEIHEVNQPKLHFFGHFHTRKQVNVSPFVESLGCFNYNRASSVHLMKVEKNADGELYFANAHVTTLPD